MEHYYNPEIETMPREEMKKLQSERLVKQVKHVYDNVKFYRDKMDAAGIKPRHSMKYYVKVYTYKAVKHLLPLMMGKAKGEEMLNRYRKKVGSSDYSNASEMMRRILSKVVNEDLKHVMPSIKASTLLVWGEKDTPLSDAKKMEKLIPDAGLVEFPGVGHYSFLENPWQFDAVINSFLEKDKRNK